MSAIRPATLADCDTIARIQVDSYRSAYTGHFPPSYLAQFSYAEQAEDWRGLLSSGSGEILLVAEEQGELSGYALARCDPRAFPGFDAEIVALHVRRPVQGRGVGRRLLQQAALELRARGCRSAMLWTLQGNPARRWYERLGGRLLGQKSLMVDAWEIVEVAYGWDDLVMLEREGEEKT